MVLSFQRTFFSFALLLGVLGLFGFIAGAVLPTPARAEALLTLLRSPEPDGGEQFARHLKTWWSNINDPSSDRLRIGSAKNDIAALQKLSRNRGHFAIVSAQTAARNLRKYPKLTTIGILWPTLLHALSRNPSIKQVGLTPSTEYWMFQADTYAYQWLKRVHAKRPEASRRIRMVSPTDWLEALNDEDEAVLLISAPARVAEITLAMSDDETLRMVPFSQRFYESITKMKWLVDGLLAARTYPRMPKVMEAPAHYRVLVGRKDLPDAAVKKMLLGLYAKQSAKRQAFPLFGDINGKMNKRFARFLSFHPLTAKMFRFTPSVE